MKILYLNDRRTEARIFIHTLHTCEAILKPGQAEYFDIGEPPQATSVPFIKPWETNIVLLSWAPENAFNK